MASMASMVTVSMGGFIMKRKIHRFFRALVVVMLMTSLVLVTPSVVQAQTLSLSSIAGPPNTVITITGSGFAPNTAGAVGFDSNGSGAIDPGEPRVSLTTTDAGFIPTGVTLTVPAVAAGVYQVLADIPLGGSVEASASFTVAFPPSPGVLLGSAR
jgi:hypothetical protein